jgi:hypothetical protein
MTERIKALPVEFVVRKQKGISKEIKSKLYIGDSQETGEPGVLLFPGIFQDGRIPRRLAESVTGGDVAGAFPYWDVSADLLSVHALSIAYPLAAIEARQEVYNTKLPPKVGLDSVAGNGGTRAEAESPDHFGDIAWLRTAGIGAKYFENRPLRELGRRAAETLKHFDQDPFVDPWNLYSGARIMRHMGLKALLQMQRGLGGGEAASIIPILMERLPQRHTDKKRNLFYSGDQDSLSTFKEHEELQEKVGKQYMELKTFNNASHRSMATLGGIYDAQTVINDLMDGGPLAA